MRFTSRPTSLLTSDRASVFFCIFCYTIRSIASTKVAFCAVHYVALVTFHDGSYYGSRYGNSIIVGKCSVGSTMVFIEMTLSA
jgi:hypothetical protein